MKSTPIYILMFLLAVVTGCGRRADNPTLVRLDSLIYSAPDSALHLLQILPADSLADEEGRAYHAILLTEAAYKAYIPATSDSAINAAEQYYADRDRAKHLRALISAGTTAEGLGHPEEAMRRYKQAETLARELDDTFRTGYALLRQAELYHGEQNTAEIAIDRYKHAMVCFETIHSDYYRDACFRSIGSLYRIVDMDSAQYYLDLAYNSAVEHSDIDRQCQILLLQAEMYLRNKDADKALELCQKVIANGQKSSSKLYFTMTEAHTMRGELGKALKTLESCPQLINAVDTMMYHLEYAKLADAMNDLKTYKAHHLIADTISDSIMMSTAALKLQSADKNYTQSQLELSIATKDFEKARTINVLLFVVLLLFIALSVVYRTHRKAVLAEAELDEANAEMFVLRTKLGEQLSMIQHQKEKLDALSSDTMTQMAIVDELRTNNENQGLAMKLHDRLLGELLHQYRERSNPHGSKMILYKLSTEAFWESLDSYTQLRYPTLMTDRVNVRDRQILVLYALQIPIKIIALCFDFSNPRSVSNELPRILQRINAPAGMNASEYMTSISALQSI